MFIVKENKIHLGFDNKYPENNQLVPGAHNCSCQDSVKRGKNCTDEWFYFLCGVIFAVGEIMLKCVESRAS